MRKVIHIFCGKACAKPLGIHFFPHIFSPLNRSYYFTTAKKMSLQSIKNLLASADEQSQANQKSNAVKQKRNA